MISLSVQMQKAKKRNYVGCYDFYSVRVDLSGDEEKLSKIEYVKGDFHNALNNEARCIQGFRNHEFLLVGNANIKVRKNEEIMPAFNKLVDSIEVKLEHLKIPYELEIGFIKLED
ncbi:hypothetical protein [Falsibacillus pallidus]|uniref:hypothetical protein n=1 Tax=Falsibacillus pallidus TaxID=493781 RepID=UPI003D9541FD